MRVQVRASCGHPTFARMAGTVSQVLDEDAHSGRAAFVNRTQQCFAVRSGLDSFLDLSRAAFCRASDDVHALAGDYRDAHDMPGLKARIPTWKSVHSVLLEVHLLCAPCWPDLRRAPEGEHSAWEA